MPDALLLIAQHVEHYYNESEEARNEMGRIVDAIKQMPGADNAMIIYIAGEAPVQKVGWSADMAFIYGMANRCLFIIFK